MAGEEEYRVGYDPNMPPAGSSSNFDMYAALKGANPTSGGGGLANGGGASFNFGRMVGMGSQSGGGANSGVADAGPGAGWNSAGYAPQFNIDGSRIPGYGSSVDSGRFKATPAPDVWKNYYEALDKQNKYKDYVEGQPAVKMKRYYELQKMMLGNLQDEFNFNQMRIHGGKNGQGTPNALGQIADYQSQQNPYYERSQQLNNAPAPDVSNYLNSILGR